MNTFTEVVNELEVSVPITDEVENLDIDDLPDLDMDEVIFVRGSEAYRYISVSQYYHMLNFRKVEAELRKR
jgi:hypothetical protein